MNKKLLISMIVILLISLYACQTSHNESVLNGSFESGNLNNWTVESGQYSNENILFDYMDNQGNYYNQEGDFFFSSQAVSGSETGVLTSEPVVVSGNYQLGFLMGAAQNETDCYVVIKDESENVIATITHTKYDGTNAMYRYVVDLETYKNKNIIIQIVDHDASNDRFNYINVDDFVMNYQGNGSVSQVVEKANIFVENNINTIDTTYRMTYHAMSAFNWANDPNGLIWYNNEFHLFYQHNPYASVWGPMHWGHYTTTDFIHWERQPIALGPDQSYDYEYGAFSGTAIEKDGMMYLMYTSVANGLQQQAIAVSSDGITFNKIDENPVISANQVPANASQADFRDPKVFKQGDMYYVIVGTKMNGLGQLLLYRSADLLNFEYVGPVLDNDIQLQGVYECPDFVEIDGQQLLIASPQNLPQNGSQFENIHSVVYMLGELNTQTGQFNYETMNEIDSGFDFYAAQTAQLPDGRVIMMAWMQMWDRTMPTKEDNWVGGYTLPRELSIIDGKLYQTPIREIENYRQNAVAFDNILVNEQALSLNQVSGKTIELDVTLDLGNASQVTLELFKGERHETKLTYDQTTQLLTLDRSNSGIPIAGNEANDQTRSVKVSALNHQLKLRIFLDVSSIEVFVNDGEHTLTANVYPDDDDMNISFYTTGGQATILSLNKYDIIS